MEQSPSREAKMSWATQEIPAFYETRRFITVYTRARPRPLCIIRNIINFLRWGVVSTSPNPQAGGPPLVGCPRLLIQNILSYPPYLQAVPPTATWGRAMSWWQHWTHLSWEMCTTDCFSTTTVLSWMRLNVTLYVYCLSCCALNFFVYFFFFQFWFEIVLKCQTCFQSVLSFVFPYLCLCCFCHRQLGFWVSMDIKK
jgi:hypothetical protein